MTEQDQPRIETTPQNPEQAELREHQAAVADTLAEIQNLFAVLEPTDSSETPNTLQTLESTDGSRKVSLNSLEAKLFGSPAAARVEAGSYQQPTEGGSIKTIIYANGEAETYRYDADTQEPATHSATADELAEAKEQLGQLTTELLDQR